MDYLSRETVKVLASYEGTPKISLLMPLHRDPHGAREDRIRLKNLLKEAEVALTESGEGDDDVLDLLDPGWKLQESRTISSGGAADGLALFLAPDFSCHYELPSSVRELVVTGETFHIKPLLPFLEDYRFYVLALSKNSVRLFEGLRSGLRSANLPAGVPKSMEEALAGTEIEKSLQHHAAPAGKGPGTEVGLVHGQGRPKDSEEKLLEEYFRLLAAPLKAFFNRERLPLVLAAVGYFHPMFRRAFQSSYLLEEGVIGSPDEMEVKELFEKALPVVEPFFEKNARSAEARFNELVSAGRVSNEVETILEHAESGRVDTVFAAEDVEIWGFHDSEKGQINPRKGREPGSVDLLNLAVMQTLVHGGDAHVVPRQRVPQSKDGSSAIASILRW